MYVIHIKIIIPHYLLINSTYPDSQPTKPTWTQFPLALCSHLCWRVRYKPKSNVSKSRSHRGRWQMNVGWLPVHLREAVSSPQLLTQVLMLETAKHQLLKQQHPQPGWDTLHPPPHFINFNQLFILLQGNRGIIGSVGVQTLASQVLVGCYLTEGLLCLFTRQRNSALCSPLGNTSAGEGKPNKTQQLQERTEEIRRRYSHVQLKAFVLKSFKGEGEKEVDLSSLILCYQVVRGSLSGLIWCNCTYPVTAGFADIPPSIPLYVPRTVPLLTRSEGRVEHKA